MRTARFRNGGRYLRGPENRHPTRIIADHELIVVQRGELAIAEAGTRFRLQPDQFLHLAPGLEHGGYETYPADLIFTWLHFEAPAAVLRTLPHHGAFARPHIAADCCSRLLDEQDRDDAPAGSCDLLLHLLLLECGNSKRPDERDPSGLAEQARIFIDTHYDQPISTLEVARHCDCHPDHLGRLFKARFDRSIGQAIQALRLRQAKSLLRDSQHDIEAIARRCGFAEAHYFRRVFKRATACSPGDWRRQHRRMQVNTP
jgi:AraC-like DNA-binding protein